MKEFADGYHVTQLQQAYLSEQMRLYRHLRASFEVFLAQYGDAGIILFGGGEMAEIARAVLAERGIAPLAAIESEAAGALPATPSSGTGGMRCCGWPSPAMTPRSALLPRRIFPACPF